VERFRFEIRFSWDGGSLRAEELACIELRLGASLELEIEATDYGDPAPASPAGRCDGLWDFEVVELFLLGRDERYLELEFGPHGHYLALRLAGRRQLVASDLAVDFEATRRGSRWHGRARAALALLPPELRAANAYSIHGRDGARRFLAWQPVPGPRPDFHRLDAFPALELARWPGLPER